MTLPSPAHEGVTVVLVGAFAPTMFHPEWFARHGLVRPSEAEEAVDAKSVVLLPDVATVRLGPYGIEVGLDRMVLSVSDRGQAAALRDLGIGVLRRLDVPLGAMGINAFAHWHARDDFDFAHKAARFSLKAQGSEHLATRLEWQLPALPATAEGSSRLLRLERSVRCAGGVFAQVNTHIAADRLAATTFLNERFDEALQAADTLLEEVLG